MVNLPEPLLSLDQVQDRYDALFCDLWGVVHNGRRPFAAACDALARFRARGGKVVLVTNVPKPRAPIPGQLDKLGVRRDAWDAIVTSGDAIRAEVARRAPGPMHLIGPSADQTLWEGLAMQLAAIEHARFLLVTGLDDFERQVPEDYRDRLARARARGLDLVCANPDVVVRLGDKLHWCAGALARDYAALGGKVVMSGKPHAPIYELALRELAGLCGREVARARVLAIGDGPSTDIVGANRQGLDALFVASGIHQGALVGPAGFELTEVAATLAEAGAAARYAMPELA